MRESTSESGAFLGGNAAVPAESIDERPHRHAVALMSRRWRGGHDLAVAETGRDNLIYALTVHADDQISRAEARLSQDLKVVTH